MQKAVIALLVLSGIAAAALCRRSRRLPIPPRINLFVYTS